MLETRPESDLEVKRACRLADVSYRTVLITLTSLEPPGVTRALPDERLDHGRHLYHDLRPTESSSGPAALKLSSSCTEAVIPFIPRHPPAATIRCQCLLSRQCH